MIQNCDKTLKVIESAINFRVSSSETEKKHAKTHFRKSVFFQKYAFSRLVSMDKVCSLMMLNTFITFPERSSVATGKKVVKTVDPSPADSNRLPAEISQERKEERKIPEAKFSGTGRQEAFLTPVFRPY